MSRIRATRSDSRLQGVAFSPSAFASSLHTANTSNQVSVVSRFRDISLGIAYVAFANPATAAPNAINAVFRAARFAALVGVAEAGDEVVSHSDSSSSAIDKSGYNAYPIA